MFYKHFKKIALALSAFFWASCTSENATQPLYGVVCPPEGCADYEISSSSGAAPISSSSEDARSSSESDVPSSSSFAESSSSSITGSSSSIKEAMSSSSFAAVYGPMSSSSPPGNRANDKVYQMAKDPSISCELYQIFASTGKCLDDEDRREWNEMRKKMLEENQTRTLAELDALEDENNIRIEYEEPLYGVQVPSCTHREIINYQYLNCSNNERHNVGSVYSDNNDVDALFIDNSENKLYTKEEFQAKYPEKFISSSSKEPESSSSVTPPSPLCKKTDFTSTGEMQEIFETQKTSLIDSVKTAKGNKLSEKQSNCIDDLNERTRYYSDRYASTTVLAKKQICDGDTIVNPRYQEKLDTHKAYFQDKINKCLETDAESPQ
jgi:hypothetical protein